VSFLAWRTQCGKATVGNLLGLAINELEITSYYVSDRQVCQGLFDTIYFSSGCVLKRGTKFFFSEQLQVQVEATHNSNSNPEQPAAASIPAALLHASSLLLRSHASWGQACWKSLGWNMLGKSLHARATLTHRGLQPRGSGSGVSTQGPGAWVGLPPLPWIRPWNRGPGGPAA
jgi:hypothetical protein